MTSKRYLGRTAGEGSLNGTPLHHMVLICTTDDLTFVRAGTMDDIVINANQLENSTQSTFSGTTLGQAAIYGGARAVSTGVPDWIYRSVSELSQLNVVRVGAYTMNYSQQKWLQVGSS
ncbi:MAG: hypothetical protein ACRDFX_03045 [Chloroflexota bacterium]